MSLIRTTIKIRENFLKDIKKLSLKDSKPIYEVVDDLLQMGFSRLNTVDERKDLFKAINRVKRQFAKAPFTAEEIYKEGKRHLR